MRTKTGIILGIITLVVFLPVSAIEFSVEKNGKQYDLNIGGSGGIQCGQIISGYGNFNQEISHAWLQSAYLGFLFDATVDERMRVILDGQIHLTFSYFAPANYIGKYIWNDFFAESYSLYIREARGMYTLGDLDYEKFFFQIHIGKFPYSYNAEARNLGEYLFRGSAYPTYMLNAFADSTSSPLMGLMLSSNYGLKPLKLDMILTSETQKYPLQDWSLAGIASVNIGPFGNRIGKVLELGAGICFDRIFAKDKDFTTPRDPDNLYEFEITQDTMYDSAGNVIWNIDDPNDIHPEWLYDTSGKYYTFQSKKAILRWQLDPKAFFDCDIFGKEDLKLYGEIGFLGFKNYGDYFDDIRERMPIMFGFNFPTFKILDVLACEVEIFKNPYVPGFEECFNNGIVKPVDRGFRTTDFYWSIYAQKKIGIFKIITQFARDHIHPVNNNLSYTERSDVLVESDDWWWAARVQFEF